MVTRCFGSAILSAALAVPVLAQAPRPMNVGNEGGSTPKAGPQGAPTMGAGGPRRGPMRIGDSRRNVRGFGSGRGQTIDKSVLDPKRLTEELSLEFQQQQDIEQIFREYNAALQDVRRQHRGDDQKRKLEQLERDLEAARQSRDTRRANEIWQQMMELRKSASDEEQQLQEILIEEIEKMLDEGQRVQFRQMLRGGKNGPRVGPLEDPEVLFSCLDKVKVEDYQKPQLEQIERRYKDDMKRRGKDMLPAEKKMMGEQLLREVLMVLNDEQEEQLRRVHSKMSGPGAGGGPVDLEDPRQLQIALMKLNTTKNRLNDDQEQRVKELRMRYMKEVREARGDDMARERLNEQLSRDLMMILTPEQQEAIKNMQMPAGRFSGRDRDRSDRRRYRRSRSGRSHNGEATNSYDDRGRGRGYRNRRY